MKASDKVSQASVNTALAEQHGVSLATIIRGRRYNRTKQAKGGDRKSSGQGKERVGVNLTATLKTADTLGKQHGVSPSTVYCVA
jgi:hypothetical protein